MTALQNLMIFCSKRFWAFLCITVIFSVALFALTQISTTFASISGGHEPLDMQNTLTAPAIEAQLSAYTTASFSTYWKFTAVDFIFPFAGGLFTAAIFAFAIRSLSTALYAKLTSKNLLPLLMLPTLFDWLENISIISVLLRYPQNTLALTSAILLFKSLKLTTLTLSQVAVSMLLLGVGIQWLTKLFRKSS
jgi:hypothetical protein